MRKRKLLAVIMGALCIAAAVPSVSVLADGQKVVVDSTMCKRTKRDAMRSLCSEAGIDPVFIYLDTPIEVLRQRLAERKGTGPNDQIVDSEHLEMFYKNFERPESDEKVMVIKQ